MTTELTTRQQSGISIGSGDVATIEKVGQWMEQSGMFGAGKGQGAIIAMTCIMEGISPLQFQRTYHIIDGRLSMRADMMLARFAEAGGTYKILRRDNEAAEAIFTFGANTIQQRVTMDEMKAAKIIYGKNGQTKDNWARFPKNMLWARLVSDAVRTIAPGIVAGVYTPEEVQDFDAATARRTVAEVIEKPQAPSMPVQVEHGPIEQLTELMKRDNITQEQVDELLTVNCLMPACGYIDRDMAQKLIRGWDKAVISIRKMEAEKQSAQQINNESEAANVNV